ncbi:MAG: DUF2795 domain-containing protein [Haloarculaceae archaeon]
MRMLDTADDAFDTQSYPTTTEALIDAVGDVELQLPNGTETVGDALSRLDSETFETAEQARTATYSAVSSKAIGRKNYSDRDPVCPGEDGPEEVSF